jgi:hypothetical protein
MKAPAILQKVADTLLQRAKQYDKPEGERSIKKAVVVFNLITGKTLREDEGWLFMQILKDIRLYSNTKEFHEDSAIDNVAYSALKAEAWYEKSNAQDNPSQPNDTGKQ